jgi:hypothetical protein
MFLLVESVISSLLTEGVSVLGIELALSKTSLPFSILFVTVPLTSNIIVGRM